MTLVQLKHLIRLAQTGSFSQSAEQLFITQPALSRSIRALETELGAALVDRIGRRSELTPFGREVLARAQHIVLETEELVGSTPAMMQGRTGTLRIGLGSGPGALLQTQLMLHMARQHPQLRFEIVRGTDTLVSALRARAVDALVADARSIPAAPDLRSELLVEMRGAFMCRAGHPLTRRRRAPTFNDLLAFPIASTPLSDEVARILVERYGPAAHPSRCITLRNEDIACLVEVVRQSDALLLTVRAAGKGLVELVTSPALQANARFSLVTLAGRAQAPAMPLISALVKALLKE